MRPSIYIFIVTGIFALSFLYLYQYALSVEFTFRLNDRTEELVSLKDEVEKLRVDIAHITSWSRIKNIADKMGFIYPDNITVKSPKSEVQSPNN